MERFYLPVAIALLLLLQAVAVHTYSQQLEWLTLENEYFVVYYRPGYEGDARVILEWAMLGRSATMKVIPHDLGIKVKVFLWDAESWGRPPWQAYASPSQYEMHMLTPSDQDKYAGTPWYCGDYCKDPRWYIYSLTHEYVHIVVDHVSREPGKSHGSAPDWLSEGFATYIPDYHTVPGMVEKHMWYYEPALKAIRSGDGYVLAMAGIRYGGQALIARYMYEVYGSFSIVCFLSSLWRLGFAGSLRSCMNVSMAEFEDLWFDWVSKTFNVSRDLYPHYTLKSLERAYLGLLEAYADLRRSCEDLVQKAKAVLEASGEIASSVGEVRRGVEGLREALVSLLAEVGRVASYSNSTLLAVTTLMEWGRDVA